MKLPIGIIPKADIESIFKESITHHRDTFYAELAKYEPKQLYSHWRSIVRSIDEIINIPWELHDEGERKTFLSYDFNVMNTRNINQLKQVKTILKKRFDDNVAIRFQQLSMMCYAIDTSYLKQGIFEKQGMSLRLNNTQNAIAYLQSRRAYYVTTLNLIPKVAKGTKTIAYIDTLNFLQYPMESCLINITTAFYNLVLNECINDFEMTSDGKVAKRNFEYEHLENFFMEPERLSLLDQMELRPDIVKPKQMLPKATSKVFSFSEVANAMSLFEGAFDKYDIKEKNVYKDLSSFFVDIAIFLKDDFHIIIETDVFDTISAKYPSLTLYLPSEQYFDNLNNFRPFQKVGNRYYTTVVLLTRFVYQTLSQSLVKNRSFQINSGFVFEDKVSNILATKGYTLTNITRINHKEFDLITIKNGKIFNFQCKNNVLDITNVSTDYQKIARWNQQLCKYYEKALIKEEKRENLIIEKTGINNIEHFVISRYPVITRNKRIINFTDLDKVI